MKRVWLLFVLAILFTSCVSLKESIYEQYSSEGITTYFNRAIYVESTDRLSGITLDIVKDIRYCLYYYVGPYVRTNDALPFDELTCMDYATRFEYMWNKYMWPKYREDISKYDWSVGRAYRTYARTFYSEVLGYKFNHAFITILVSVKPLILIEVEPQACNYYGENFFMSVFWPGYSTRLTKFQIKKVYNYWRLLW